MTTKTNQFTLAAIFSDTAERSVERWRQVTVMISTLLVLFPIFKSYFWRPNSLNYSLGGDGLVLYYNMVYHLRFDHGTMLQGMNYPYGEYIFLTDAQGALATLLQWFSQHVFDISNYAIGIVNVVNLWLIPLCSLAIYHILKSLKVRTLVSIPFSVLIAVMSPQVLRLAGHFGLAYPFLIPLCMLWFLRKYRLDGRLEWRDIGLLGLLIFFAYNNPYTGFSAAGLLILAGAMLLVAAFINKKQLRTGIMATAMGSTAMLIPFLDFHFNDPCHDRIIQQFGFFFYHASLDGLLFPPGSLLNHLMRISGIKYTHEIQIESYMGIGIVAAFLFAALSLRGIISLFMKRNLIPKLLPSSFKFLLAGSVILYLLAANYSLYGWAKDWMEANLGPLLMFKAAGRIGWSFYYTTTISSVVFFDFLLRKIQRQTFAKCLILLVVLVWALEFNLYMGARFKDVFYENYFSEKHEQDLQAELAKNQFNPNDYAAILSLPKMMAWSDLFRGDLVWATQFYSMRISVATGLPMLNAMLSRISTSQCAEGVQLTSHPVIEKERLTKLPSDKDILLVVGTENTPLKFGEQYLVDHAQLVLKAQKFSLYRLSLKGFSSDEFREKARSERSSNQENGNQDLQKLTFDEKPSSHIFYGKGALTIPKGTTQVAKFTSKMEVETQYVFAAWHFIDFTRYDLGIWKIAVSDSLGQVVSSQNLDAIEGYDVQNGWIRSEATVQVPKQGSVSIEIASSREIFVDELLFFPIGANFTYENTDAPDFIWNGYRVKKQAVQ